MAKTKTSTALPEFREVKVARVIDGKTFETDHGESVQLVNMYVPPMGVPGCYAARKRLQSLIGDKVVRIRIEPKRVDRYGRTIAILAA